MKKLLIQLDTDPHPSPFDTIVAYDAGVDAVLSFGGVTVESVRDLVHGAMFTRGPGDLTNTAIWVGGSDVTLGEQLLAEVTATFFGPFRVSAMLDCDGCNTTAAAAVARLLGAADLAGRRVAIVGVGPVGLRAATLLREAGCDVLVCGLPADLFEGREYRRARGLTVAERLELQIAEPADRDALREALDGAACVLAAGPAGMQILPQDVWAAVDSIEVVADFSAAEPLGVEGVEATDDLAEREGRRVLGALAIGGAKMKVHRACVRRLFEQGDLVLDAEGVYAVATGLA